MKNVEPYSITAGELAERGRENFPGEALPSSALVYSSPATLAYNSPGAEGYGVKRAGLVMPESVMLLISPGCCGRNSTILSRISGYADRMFYLNMDETDLVTGRHLTKIPEAVREILEVPAQRPKVVMLCLTCVDALLGSDFVRVCKKAEQAAGVPVVPTYMYALTREGMRPPMARVRQTLYSLLVKKKKNPHAVNLLGHFAPLYDDCEIYPMFRQAGLTEIREISRCETLEEYMEMGEANFNLVLDPEARHAAEDLMKRLDMPYIELTRQYRIDRIARQYSLFAGAIGVTMDDTAWRDEAENRLAEFREKYPALRIAIGQMVNASPFELAAALSYYGYEISRIFAGFTPDDLPYIRDLAGTSPETRIYTGISPTMMYYRMDGAADLTIGKDARYYYPDTPCAEFCSDVQPFGYRGLVRLLDEMEHALEEQRSSMGIREEAEAVEEGSLKGTRGSGDAVRTGKAGHAGDADDAVETDHAGRKEGTGHAGETDNAGEAAAETWKRFRSGKERLES